MALDGTNTGLVATLTSFLNRGDLATDIPDFIKLAEARINRLIRSKNVTLLNTLSLAQASVALPVDVKEPRTLVITTSGYEGPIEITSLSRLHEERAKAGTVTGRPLFGALVNDVLHLSPTPNVAYTATLTYEPLVQPLATAGSNWLCTNHPDIYLYGALIEASPFLRDDPRVPQFEARFEKAFKELELARERSEYPNTPVQRIRAIG